MKRAADCFLLLLIFHSVTVLGQALEARTTDEDDYYTFEDYGDEKLLWGKESSPQWCEAPKINQTLGDRFTVRSSFIDANSKRQYATETVVEVKCGPERRLKFAHSVIYPLVCSLFPDAINIKIMMVALPESDVYLRCTLNSSGIGSVWLMVGAGGSLMELWNHESSSSPNPSCVYGEPSFYVCELPHLIHHGLRLTGATRSQFFKNNETLTISLTCALTLRVLSFLAHTREEHQLGWQYYIIRSRVISTSNMHDYYKFCMKGNEILAVTGRSLKMLIGLGARCGKDDENA
ncbi:unnamed protein product [Gongylonema pulchrum]|uniref:Ig-like domain-containing protein n=1 Tax=Gongylonema pulchrum TaxID=637853 RepID=A0A183CXN1_9BILA|nr:unnamed protein product [Gongylonema pulchrum]